MRSAPASPRRRRPGAGGHGARPGRFLAQLDRPDGPARRPAGDPGARPARLRAVAPAVRPRLLDRRAGAGWSRAWSRWTAAGLSTCSATPSAARWPRPWRPTGPTWSRTLTLISPALPDLRPNRARTQVAVLATPVVGSLLSRRLNDLSPEQRVAGLLEIVYSDPSVVTSEQRALAEEEVRRRSELPYAVDALASSARALLQEFLRTGSGGLWRLAARVTAPTLVLYGRQDQLVVAQPRAEGQGVVPERDRRRGRQRARRADGAPRAGRAVRAAAPGVLGSGAWRTDCSPTSVCSRCWAGCAAWPDAPTRSASSAAG